MVSTCNTCHQKADIMHEDTACHKTAKEDMNTRSNMSTRSKAEKHSLQIVPESTPFLMRHTLQHREAFNAQQDSLCWSLALMSRNGMSYNNE